MARPAFGSKPSVLRCSRCGRFVDWEDARLQIVCGCRPRIELPEGGVRAATAADRPRISALFLSDFGRSKFVAFGEEFHVDTVPAIVAEMDGDLAGALGYRLQGDRIEIVALATAPEWQRSGVGGQLVDHAERLGREHGAGRVAVATTNDNIPALYFYQRRGYRLMEVVRDAVFGISEGVTPVGFGGIPIRDEFHLVRAL